MPEPVIAIDSREQNPYQPSRLGTGFHFYFAEIEYWRPENVNLYYINFGGKIVNESCELNLELIQKINDLLQQIKSPQQRQAIARRLNDDLEYQIAKLKVEISAQ